MDREFQIFVKPVGSDCNLGCTYCYYLRKKDLYPEISLHRMAEDILERYIVQHIEASTGNVIMFAWHGGEPALAGIEFYRKAVKLQRKHLPAGARLINGIQTNGTLLDDRWCRFLSDENFLVGISMDGPEEYHERYRSTVAGGPTFSLVMKGYELLKKHGLTTEILCVLNSYNAGYPLALYDFFKGLGAGYMTFLPLVEQQAGQETGVSPASVNPVDYGHFLMKVFDEWIAKDIGVVRIQVFEEAAATAFGQEHTLCIFKRVCGGVPVVEHNGDFYQCDHYVDRDHLIGNIMKDSIAGLLDSPRQKEFGNVKSSSLPRFCRECDVLDMCNGECPRNRFIHTPDDEPGLNYLCPGYKIFFRHCRPFVEALRIASVKGL